MFKVTFSFEDGSVVETFANAGDNLLEVARSANVAIDAPCSGNGACGKCRVQLKSGELESKKTLHISDEEYQEGWRLACCSKISADVNVLVPDIASAYKSRMKVADLSSKEEIAIFENAKRDVELAGIELKNSLEVVDVTMDPPSLDDTMPDNERLTRSLRKYLNISRLLEDSCRTMGSITNDRDRTENKKYTGIRILAVLFWIAVWQIASMWLGQEILLASPVSVIRRLFELIFTGDFWRSAGFSFGRIVLGFSMALILGILLAVLAFLSQTVEILVNPVLTAVKSTPVASFIILCLIWIPSRNLSVFISFLMVLPVIYTNILEGIRQTDRQILEMAKVFQVSMGRQIRYIYVSQILPYFVSACRLSLGMCWKAGVAAEVIGVPRGSIGEKLYNAKIYLETPDLFAWTIVIIVISFVFEKCFLWLVRKGVYCVEHK